MRISPVNLKILAYTLEVEGHESAGLMARCELPPHEEIDENGPWVHVDVFDRMMAAVVEVTGDPSFGLIAGKSLALMRYGAITPVVTTAPSLRHILADVARLGRLTVEQPEIILDEAGERARLLVQPLVQHGLSGHFRTEQVATSTMQMLRFVGASNADIHEVAFPYAEPMGQAQRYRATFGPRTVFERPVCALSFNRALLDNALPSHDAVGYLAAKTRAEALLAALHAGTDLADQVRQCLLSALPAQLSVAEVATRLDLNERQLRRQLAMLGSSHAELQQECLRLMAERLLAEGRLPLKQIADDLGFGSVHSFHRAFKRWFGTTPSAWKQD
jgi:AraC-like DNA-binding protein